MSWLKPTLRFYYQQAPRRDKTMIQEENGQIIVDELRPMSELKPGEYAICYRVDGLAELLKRSIEFQEKITDSEGFYYYDDNKFKGFLPVPIYRPKDGA